MVIKLSYQINETATHKDSSRAFKLKCMYVLLSIICFQPKIYDRFI